MASTITDQKTLAGNAPGRRCWRDVIKIHPAAELFPQLPPDELKALGEDIRKHGMQASIALLVPEGFVPTNTAANLAHVMLLDGRNRLDACEAVGLEVFDETGNLSDSIPGRYVSPPGSVGGVDPAEFVISANIRRRHLTTAQKRELIAKLLREKPERSDRQTAELAKVHHTTVGTIRTNLEATGEISQLTQTVGKDGKERPRGYMVRAIEAAREAPQQADVSLDEAVRRMLDPGAEASRPAVAPIFYTRNADPKLPLPPPRSLTTPLSSRTNGAAPPPARNLAIDTIVKHLHHNPTMFLSDLAMILADDQTRLARVSIHNRRIALAKIGRALGLPIVDAAALRGE